MEANKSLEFADGLRRRIEDEYNRLGHSQGWRLLYSPIDVLAGAPAAFLGLNPGGLLSGSVGHGELATPRGTSAYRDEVWKPPRRAGEEKLQQQALAVFDRLGVEPTEVLAGNLVPFRSQDLDRLDHRGAAFAFGEQIWRDIFDHAGVPPIVVTMGKPVFTRVARLLDAGAIEEVPYDWGREVAGRARFPGGLLIGLPHLSRRPIMLHEARQRSLNQLFAGT